MNHWTEPLARGAWSHPAAWPPRPRQHYDSTNTVAELARVVEHLEWAARDRARIEHDSMRRADDLTEWIQEVEDRQDTSEAELGARLSALERDKHVRQFIWAKTSVLGTSLGACARWAMGCLLLLLALSLGQADDAKVKEIKQILRVISGTSSPN